jgi:hypothetical protein
MYVPLARVADSPPVDGSRGSQIRSVLIGRKTWRSAAADAKITQAIALDEKAETDRLSGQRQWLEQMRAFGTPRFGRLNIPARAMPNDWAQTLARHDRAAIY